jgi:ferredoxin
MSFAGDRFCTYACLGYGDCAKVCPRNAISVDENGVASIEPSKCIGCGLCVKACPNGLIHIIKDTERVAIKCSNHKKGADVRKICSNGCIACGKCVKNCPEGAITLVDNLAVIDYEKCSACGTCKDVCPVGCIHEGHFRCGAHFE